jgi:hypothetical protein
VSTDWLAGLPARDTRQRIVIYCTRGSNIRIQVGTHFEFSKTSPKGGSTQLESVRCIMNDVRLTIVLFQVSSPVMVHVYPAARFVSVDLRGLTSPNQKSRPDAARNQAKSRMSDSWQSGLPHFSHLSGFCIVSVGAAPITNSFRPPGLGFFFTLLRCTLGWPLSLTSMPASRFLKISLSVKTPLPLS